MLRGLPVVIGSVCVISALLGASEKMPAHPSFYSARTLAIVNDSGYANIGDKAYDELRKWGRYQIIPDPRSADLVFVVTANERYAVISGPTRSTTTATVIGNTVHANTTSYPSTQTVHQGWTYVYVFDKEGQKIWSDSRRWRPLFFGSATRAVIKEIRKRVEQGAPAADSQKSAPTLYD